MVLIGKKNGEWGIQVAETNGEGLEGMAQDCGLLGFQK